MKAIATETRWSDGTVPDTGWKLNTLCSLSIINCNKSDLLGAFNISTSARGQYVPCSIIITVSQQLRMTSTLQIHRHLALFLRNLSNVKAPTYPITHFYGNLTLHITTPTAPLLRHSLYFHNQITNQAAVITSTIT